MGSLVGMKIHTKIKMNKLLNNYDGVLAQLKAKEEMELELVDNTMKKEKTENEDEKVENTPDGVLQTKSRPDVSGNDNEEKIEEIHLEDDKESTREENVENTKTGAEDKYKARLYDLGLLLTKVIKKIFFCLTERQQIGEKLE